MKEPVKHHDILGKEIQVGQFVASYNGNGLAVFRVERMTPKMVRITRDRKSYSSNGTRQESVVRYGYDLAILDTEEVVLHQLTK